MSSPSEPSTMAEHQAVELAVEANTPWGPMKIAVPMTTTVDRYVEGVVRGAGHEDPGDYTLEIPWKDDYTEVDGDELVVDALRGVQARPRIVKA